MCEKCLSISLAYSKKHPEEPIPKKNKNASRPKKTFLATIRKIIRRITMGPTIIATKLKKHITGLAVLTVCSVQ